VHTVEIGGGSFGFLAFVLCLDPFPRIVCGRAEDQLFRGFKGPREGGGGYLGSRRMGEWGILFCLAYWRSKPCDQCFPFVVFLH
jgi:hypothetical protein